MRLPPRLPALVLFILMALPVLLQAQYRVTEPNYDEYVDALLSERGFFVVSNLWILIAAAMVFIMHLGFASLEAGLTRSKNTVNILYKNVFVITAGLVLYAFLGFRTMYPGEDFNGFLSFGWWIGVNEQNYLDLMSSRYASYTWWADFIFQAMFAATAATIVSGAVAERIKLHAFMIIAVVLVGVAYPIAGSWEWGGGWLDDHGFHDFAGSSIVHSFGGWAALACVLVLGPRRGKYGPGGSVRPIPGHSMPLAAIGVFLLWFGWFGFNGGSVLSAHPEDVAMVFVNTALAGASGGLLCMLTTVFALKKPDLSMALNGILAGLVGITAGADVMGPGRALLVGAVAGVIVVYSVILFDRIGVDDPVGAISVHGVCGVWGTLAVALIGGKGTFLWQLIGVMAYGIIAFGVAFAVAYAIKATIGLRVDEREEEEGLDIGEHGQEAYAQDARTLA